MAKRKRKTECQEITNVIDVKQDEIALLREEVDEIENAFVKPVSIKPVEQVKKCKVLSYNLKEHYIDVLFESVGIRITNTICEPDTFVDVKYTGQIGTPDFKYHL